MSMKKVWIGGLWLLGLAAIAWWSNSAPLDFAGASAVPSASGHGEPPGRETTKIGEKK